MGVIATSTPPSGSVIATGRDGWQTAAAYLAPDLLHGLRRHAGEESWIEPLDGTLLMADISGFTRMSERLAEIGKEGAEWLTNTINHYFESMLDAGRRYGGSNLKFGGDALLLSFTGDEHARRAVRAALAMQSENRRFTAVRLAKERIRLKMSIGAHSGRFWSATAGVPGQRMQHFVLGADACRVAGAEAVAEAGEVVVTPETIELLGDARTVEKDGMSLVLSMSRGSAVPVLDEPWVFADQSVISYLPPPIAAALQTPEMAELGVGEHRKTTVIFLHVLGVEALIAGEGPATALKELQEYVSLVVALAEKYGGFLAGSDIYNEGLKLILVFGAPVAREQDAANALRLSLELRERLPELGLRLKHRMGVNSGYVFAGDIGTEYRREYTVMGDAVNLAARLMSAAEWGQVLASKRTIEEAGTGFEASPLDPIRVKGKSRPIDIGAVEREAEVSARPHVERSSELVGREAELGTLRDICLEVEDAAARVVTIGGEPGIGKSRLTADFLDYLAMRGWSIHRAQCQSHMTGNPFAPWAGLLYSLLHCDRDALPDSQAEGALAAVGAIDSDLVDAAPLLSAIMPLPISETETTRSLDEEARRRRLFELVASLVSGAGRQHPLALVVEDVHWADNSSLQLLAHVAEALGADRVMILATSRTRDPVDAGAESERVRVVWLEELSAEGALHMVRSVLGMPALDRRIAAALMEKARGNPLFLAEVARSLRESGELQRLTALSEAQLGVELAALDIPDRVQSLIMSRIDALGSVTKEVLRGASVLGASFDGAAVRAVLEADLAGGGLARSMAELADTDLIEAEGDERFRFAHALIQDVAYESLLYSRRRQLHQRAGSYYEIAHSADLSTVCETLVYHYMRGGNKPRALLYSVRAGDKARLVFANEEAVEHYKRAVALAGDVGVTRVDALHADVSGGSVHSKLADVLELMGSHGEAVRHYGRALAAIGGSGLTRLSLKEHWPAPEWFGTRARRQLPQGRRAIGDICRKVGLVHQRLSDYKTARTWLVSALFTLPRNSPVERCQACMGMALVSFRTGEFQAAREWCLRGLRSARKGDQMAELAHVYNGIGTIDYARGLLRRAMGYHLRALAIYEEIADPRGMADTLNNLANDHWDLGEWSLAVQSYEKCLEVATKTGDVDALAIAHNNLGEVFVDQGEIARAKAEFRWTIEARKKIGNVAISALAEANLGQALMHEGRFKEARICLENSLSEFKQIKVPAFEAYVGVRLASLSLAEGYAEEGKTVAENALSMARKLSVEPTEESALLVLGQAELARQNWAAAEESLSLALRIAAKTGNRYGQAKANMWLGRLSLMRPAGSTSRSVCRRAVTRLRKAKAILEALGAGPDLRIAEESLLLADDRARFPRNVHSEDLA